MLLELAKPVALILCLLSLYAVFHTLFLSIEDPHLILVPHKAFDDSHERSRRDFAIEA